MRIWWTRCERLAPRQSDLSISFFSHFSSSILKISDAACEVLFLSRATRASNRSFARQPVQFNAVNALSILFGRHSFEHLMIVTWMTVRAPISKLGYARSRRAQPHLRAVPHIPSPPLAPYIYFSFCCWSPRATESGNFRHVNILSISPQKLSVEGLHTSHETNKHLTFELQSKPLPQEN